MGYAARNFVTAIPYWTIPPAGVAPYLLGQQAWWQFERSRLCKDIFEPAKDGNMLEEAMGTAWHSMEDYLTYYAPLVRYHLEHGDSNRDCELCSRFAQLADEYWWDTSDAARHVQQQVRVFFLGFVQRTSRINVLYLYSVHVSDVFDAKSGVTSARNMGAGAHGVVLCVPLIDKKYRRSTSHWKRLIAKIRNPP